MRSLPLKVWGFLILASLMVASGCAFVVGDKVVGIESGKFFYGDGVLKTDYKAPFDQVWTACEKTITDMKAAEIAKSTKIGFGTIDSVIGDEKVRIDLEYTSKEITSVGVRVGMAGNNLASQLIHEKIRNNLVAK